MTRTTVRRLFGTMLFAGILAPVAAAGCNQLPGGGKLPGVPGVPGACELDVTKPEAIAAFDFQKEFSLQAAAAAKLKGGALAAVEIKAFADKVDADLKVACGALNKDLGGADDKATGKESCEASAKLIADMRAKLGGGAKLTMTIDPPQCSIDASVYSDCSAKCDASATPGSVKAECQPGKLQGECSAKCKGSCEMSAAAKCEGTCSGSCDANFSGTCGGKCEGKCDSKNSSGTCNGKCEGKCDAHASGTCKGNCGGSCQISGEAECKGTCSGSCTAEMKAPRCTGEVTPPKVSAECKAHCDAQVNAQAKCSKGHIAVVVTGYAEANAKVAEQLKVALQNNLPAILVIAEGMGKATVQMASNVKTTLEGLEGGIEGLVSGGGGAANSAMIAGKITACFGGTFKGAYDAAASLKANVDVSVSVKAKAEGSASGSAGTK